MQTEEDVVPIPAITFLMGFIKDKIMCINKNKEFLPYYEKARDVLDYDAETGVVTRFVKSSNSHKEAGAVNDKGYRQIGVTLSGIKRDLLAHRLAWFITHGELPNVIDHVDGDRLNNAIKNLRSGTQQENTFNTEKRTNNTSGYKGVSWSKSSEKWHSQIKYNGKSIHLGFFNCPKEASMVYETKSRELFGEFYRA
jgi:hypothetical protein